MGSKQSNRKKAKGRRPDLVLADVAYGGGSGEGVPEVVPLVHTALVQPRGHVRKDGTDPFVNHRKLHIAYQTNNQIT